MSCSMLSTNSQLSSTGTASCLTLSIDTNSRQAEQLSAAAAGRNRAQNLGNVVNCGGGVQSSKRLPADMDHELGQCLQQQMQVSDTRQGQQQQLQQDEHKPCALPSSTDLPNDKSEDSLSDRHSISNIAPGSTISQALGFIKRCKLAENRPILFHPEPGSSAGASSAGRDGTTSVPLGSCSRSSNGSAGSSNQAKWVQPSGPRKPGEGVENEEQGIIAADLNPAGAVLLRITLLAAGFVIGPSGSSVRDIMHLTGCDIKSWTDQKARRPCRVFVLEGVETEVVAAATIITAAVDRYKELCEGKCMGLTVGRSQKVMGVEFSYQPPPKSVVPYAAALKGHIPRPGASRGQGRDASAHAGAASAHAQHDIMAQTHLNQHSAAAAMAAAGMGGMYGYNVTSQAGTVGYPVIIPASSQGPANSPQQYNGAMQYLPNSPQQYNGTMQYLPNSPPSPYYGGPAHHYFGGGVMGGFVVPLSTVNHSPAARHQQHQQYQQYQYQQQVNERSAPHQHGIQSYDTHEGTYSTGGDDACVSRGLPSAAASHVAANLNESKKSWSLENAVATSGGGGSGGGHVMIPSSPIRYDGLGAMPIMNSRDVAEQPKDAGNDGKCG
ncbi:hypothetical protein CEUSTIGMA_g1090.t1 [Chlamydomonas eustigma]|uniref:K Homology domain-containing protein n=1 Tax=Chlamydomonas eustigma TaxID=1157962 RepID=A0A250WSG9_9CHLO|nr:hypothetical protein CEUSTIGMA_g1090.t1 [Chlamydomonas eustigma]|eukprot:GAX73639.1 hypothetical protein CEUSTIGMA_g1090.t1 [Chlamydomonas eustigma]